MKKYINKLFVLGTLLFLGASCESDAELTTLKTVPFPSNIEASSTTLVLNEETEDQSVELISWHAVAFPVGTPVTYALQIDIIPDITGPKAWLKSKRIEAGEDVLSKALIGRDLNKIAIDLGLLPNVAGKLVVRVEASVDHKVYSDYITLTVTPYEKSVVFGEIYMPGFYQGEFNVGTAAALTAISKGVYQGYVTLPAGNGTDFKLNTARNWDQYYGAGNSNNDLKNGSEPNFHLPGAGSYQIKVNLNTLKWTSTPYAWGIAGDATHAPTPEDKDYGWNNAIPMSYDHQTKTWKITANLLPGSVKFKLNNNWSVNYGPADSSTNTVNLDNGGAYGISEAGTYEITFKIDEVDPVSNGYPATATCTIVKK